MADAAAAAPPTPEQQAAIQAQLIALAPYLTAFQMTYACCLSVLVWETITHWRTEYLKIWRAPFSLVSIAYFFCRYGTLAVYGTYMYYYTHNFENAEDCSKAFLYGPIFSVFGIAGTQAILLLRTYALYGRARWILYVLVPWWIASMTTQWVIAAVDLKPFPRFPGIPAPCLPTGDAVLSAYFILPMSFDLVTAGLAFYRLIVLRKQGATLRSGSVLETFFRDGLVYYIATVAINLLSVLLYTAAPALLKVQGSAPAVILSAVFGARLVLGLKAEDSTSMATIGASNAFRSTMNTSSGINSKNQFNASSIPMPTLSQSGNHGLESFDAEKGDFGHSGVRVDVEKHHEIGAV